MLLNYNQIRLMPGYIAIVPIPPYTTTKGGLYVPSYPKNTKSRIVRIWKSSEKIRTYNNKGIETGKKLNPLKVGQHVLIEWKTEIKQEINEFMAGYADRKYKVYIIPTGLVLSVIESLNE